MFKGIKLLKHLNILCVKRSQIHIEWRVNGFDYNSSHLWSEYSSIQAWLVGHVTRARRRGHVCPFWTGWRFTLKRPQPLSYTIYVFSAVTAGILNTSAMHCSPQYSIHTIYNTTCHVCLNHHHTKFQITSIDWIWGWTRLIHGLCWIYTK